MDGSCLRLYPTPPEYSARGELSLGLMYGKGASVNDLASGPAPPPAGVRADGCRCDGRKVPCPSSARDRGVVVFRGASPRV